MSETAAIEPAQRAAALIDAARAGLTRPLKELGPEIAYDAHGGRLFERLCAQPEYYVTRVERALLLTHGAGLTGERSAELVELGCRPRAHSQPLVANLARRGLLRRYRPVDLCADAVHGSLATVADTDPGVPLVGVVGDYERSRFPRDGHMLFTLLGGVLGNHRPLRRQALLTRLRRSLREGDQVLFGVELVNDPEAMRRAYDDRAGVAAALSRNALVVLNHRLGADFDPSRFEHLAHYDASRERVEVRLRARERCTMQVPGAGLTVSFEAGEELITKISEKFTRDRVLADLAAAGLDLRAWHTDAAERFALVLAAPEAGACA